MKRYTPDEFARVIAPDRLLERIRRGLDGIRPAVRRAVAGDAVANRMRDAGSEPVRRRSDDTGPLRITSRPGTDPVRYAKAVRGGVAGSIDRIAQTAPLRITYEMGVDLKLVPQGHNELPGRGRPARPTFTASIVDKARELRAMVRDAFTDAVRGAVR